MSNHESKYKSPLPATALTEDAWRALRGFAARYRRCVTPPRDCPEIEQEAEQWVKATYPRGRPVFYKPHVESGRDSLRLRRALSLTGPGLVTSQVMRPPGVKKKDASKWLVLLSTGGVVREVVKAGVFLKHLTGEEKEGVDVLSALGIKGKEKR